MNNLHILIIDTIGKAKIACLDFDGDLCLGKYSKHCKNCECCLVSIFIVKEQIMSRIQVVTRIVIVIMVKIVKTVKNCQICQFFKSCKKNVKIVQN